MSWVLILLRYNSRPRHYVYNKNDYFLRDISPVETNETVVEAVQEETLTALPSLQPLQLIRAEMAVDDPRAKFNIRADRKGVLRAYLREVKEETI